ncbi:ATP-dependent nuclease [Mycobacteroides abscessus]|uniref:DUF2813 domain-containing protein n=1 Tax=Mycobacteroides abscessus TaxID=36809 RepID=A0ABD7HPW5_9MYCO|nr:AAA family ATPase [Mycobacteroides abscessus]AWG62993.1 DUF2813 domain-containing protein [Mycobacteroides abscessus]PVA29592.1 DUF2813 domain-containing protein [Mycobacteroides abscessus]PVA43499.1 DUF2813 domain-containing protein [Mycobacteroides abscessus]PVA73547.1 DUF2813 domain-containing protein [Mycobacteroides abscessus]PVB12112.1 DUF2813 domain-containing protein [Mycobacteroides abscessus]
MRIEQLSIQNFRGVRRGTVNFRGDALLVGGNSVGKSTVCDALDLVLGPERMFRRPVIDEWDFWGGGYQPTEDITPEVRIEVIVAGLNDIAQRRFRGHLRRWDRTTSAFVPPAGDGSTLDEGEWCLSVGFIGRFNPGEDDFEGGTFFLHPQQVTDGDSEAEVGAGLRAFTREDKRLCGFLYLRAIRTGNRALSFERGSLVDTILRQRSQSSPGLLATVIDDLGAVGLASSNPALDAMRDELSQRVRQFLALSAAAPDAVDVKPSDLTREQVRQVLRIFIAGDPSTHLVPFTRLSTGTLNVLVFALLTYIAEIAGQDNVIFAMEEPEIALPPHTQRRLIDFVTSNMGQTIVTSHSPYVIEQFEPQQIVALRRDTDGTLSSRAVQLPASFKLKRYRENRRQFAESLLARGIVVVEGATEAVVIAAAAEILAEDARSGCEHLDILGISIFDAQGDSSVPMYAPLFKTLGKATFGFHDQPKVPFTPEQISDAAAFDVYAATPYLGIEDLLSTEMPLDVIDRFLRAVATRTDNPRPDADLTELDETGRRRHVKTLLKARKGSSDGYAAILMAECVNSVDLPATVANFLKAVVAYTNTMDVPAPAAGVDDGTSEQRDMDSSLTGPDSGEVPSPSATSG